MKRLALDTDYLVKAYESGESAEELAHRFNIGKTTLYRRLYQCGCAHRPVGSRIELGDRVMRDVLRQFNSGIGIAGIAKSMGISANVLERRFYELGIPTRDRSEQQYARMARTTDAERKALAKNANEAVRGTHPSRSTLEQTAATYERLGVRKRSVYEDKLRRMLSRRCIATVPQKAIGIYNCDLAAYPVAVEVFGGKWHWGGAHLARVEPRFREIMNFGWNIIAVAISDSSPLTPAVADYVASYIESVRRNPPKVREYRVIWRAGEDIASGCVDDDHISIEPPFTNARDISTGRYLRVRR